MDEKYLSPMFAEGLRESRSDKFWNIACSRMETIDILACKAIVDAGHELNYTFMSTVEEELTKREVEKILLGDDDAHQERSN